MSDVALRDDARMTVVGEGLRERVDDVSALWMRQGSIVRRGG
jgi:hypothetical protein